MVIPSTRTIVFRTQQHRQRKAKDHVGDNLPFGCAGGDAFLLEALFRNETWGFMLQPVSQANEEALCQSMVDGCR